MLDDAKPGQSFRCTIIKEPNAEAPTKTITRLMRQDPDTRRTLRRSQDARRKGMVSYIRGGRRWYKRAKCGKSVKVEAGQSWTMAYTPQLIPDLKSVESYLKIESA